MKGTKKHAFSRKFVNELKLLMYLLGKGITMGKRQATLKNVIYKNHKPYLHPKPSAAEYQSSQDWTQIEAVYRKLSGQSLVPPTRFGPWDVSTSKFIIELDEERHFNRYRLTTLENSFYKRETSFSVDRYTAYCEKYEIECLKAARWGKNWRNDSTEKLFGLSNGEGDLTMGGSSRWKQRAYNDFLRDVTSPLIHVPVLRLSIYDKYKGKTLNELLLAENEIEILNAIEEAISVFN